MSLVILKIEQYSMLDVIFSIRIITRFLNTKESTCITQTLNVSKTYY